MSFLVDINRALGYNYLDWSRYMTKRRAKSILILLGILLFIGIIATYISFPLPFSIGGVNYKYSSFVENLKTSNELSEGVVLDFRLSVPEGENITLDSGIDSTISGLKDVIIDLGYNDVSITLVENDDYKYLSTRVGGFSSYNEMQKFITNIGEPSRINFRYYTDTAVDGENYIKFLSGNEIKSVEPYSYIDQDSTSDSYGKTVHAVIINFTDNGKKILADITEKIVSNEYSSSNTNLYIYFGDNQESSSSLSEAIDGGQLVMSGGNITDASSAKTYATRIKTGTLTLDLQKLSATQITPKNGINANIALIATILVFTILVIALLIYMYKYIGIIIVYCTLFASCIGIFILSTIPNVFMNIGGVLGILLSLILIIQNMVLSIQYAKKEYLSGKKLHVSFKSGLNKSLVINISVCVALALIGGIMAILPVNTLKSFGLVVFVFAFINPVVSQALFRGMIKLTLPFNSKRGEKCNFKLEAKDDN